MMQGLINRAQRSIEALVSKYVTRVAVAVPFVVALGFGTTAASVKLGEAYGSTIGYAIMAAIYAGVGLVAVAAIAANSPPQPTASEAVQSAPESNKADQAAEARGMPMTPELIMAALATAGPAAVPAIMRLLVKNLPLLLAVVALAYLLFSERRAPEDTGDTIQSP
jgi:hypothetical protein